MPRVRAAVIEADERCRFAGRKRDAAWVWVERDTEARRGAAAGVGNRSEFAAWCLWRSLPAEYRAHALFCADFLPAYWAVIPEERHAAAGKDAGLTSHVERFWRTGRQRGARFVRSTPTVSERLENHLGALGFFIHLYNSSR